MQSNSRPASNGHKNGKNPRKVLAVRQRPDQYKVRLIRGVLLCVPANLLHCFNLRTLFFSGELLMSRIRNAAFALAVAALFAVPARAANIFTITQSQSQLNLTAAGSFLGGNLTITEQNPSATTRYNGTIAVNNYGLPAPGALLGFAAGGAANAVNPPGNFQPNVGGGAGQTAGNYGVNIEAAIGFEIPEGDIPIGDINFDPSMLGTIESFTMKLAVRNLVLDVTGGPTEIGPGGTFDPTSTSLSIVSGFADLNGSLVFNTGSLLNKVAAYVALTALVSQVPDLGLTVTTPDGALGTRVGLGIGTRLDLAELAGTALPNLSATDGTITYGDELTASTLTLPVDIALPGLDGLGLPGGILDLQLGLTGQLLATGLVTEVLAVPEPSTLVLGSLAAVGLIVAARRRRSA
jgi:hypothetical protein